jgi:hypothetical protein
LVGGLPGVELQTVIDALPSGDAGDRLPVALPAIGVAMATSGVVGVIAVGVEIVLGTGGIPWAICPGGVEQITTVPGVVGSEASGTGASVVSGVPGRLAAENGLGPLSGDVKIVPGVDGRAIAVLPMVETCARLALQPNSRMAVVSSKRRIAIPPFAPA